MWVSKKDEWHSRHSLLTKYFVERIIQLVDYDENISNKHRTVNGPILIEEIIELCDMVLKRQKSVNRLRSILTEAIESKIPSSLINDYVCRSHFSDIIKFYTSFNLESLQQNGHINEKVIKDLSIRSRVFSKRLRNFYLHDLQKDFSKLNEDEKVFRRNAFILDKLLNCFIPYVLYNGYSATSIREVAIKLVKRPGNNPIEKFFTTFNFESWPFTFLINVGDKQEEYQIFLDQLNKQQIKYEVIDAGEIDNSIFFSKVQYESNDKFIRIKDLALDPHSYLTTLYDDALKYTVVSKNRTSLQFYTIFFDYAYWKADRGFKYYPINVNLDPINTLNRESTLRSSLIKLSIPYGFQFSKDTELPYLSGIEQSVYFYNLALGSKSIENSISLLWTSLESLIPYHPKANDIDNIQHFVSLFLSIGSIGRQLSSFVVRYRNSNKSNDDNLSKLETNNFDRIHTVKGLQQWMRWLTKSYTSKSKDDPFSKINETSVLLCHQYCEINEIWGGKYNEQEKEFHRGKVQLWLDKIERSELSIKYQLDRIYLHRNQIVHSGTFINEYSNMWSHLEWYVGKLLTYCYLYHYETKGIQFTQKDVFMKLEGEVEHIKNILINNKNKDITAIADLYPTIFKPSWQFF